MKQKIIWKVPSLETIQSDIKNGLFDKIKLEQLYSEFTIEEGYPQIAGETLFKKAKELYKIPKEYQHWKGEFVEQSILLANKLKNTIFTQNELKTKLDRLFIKIMMAMQVAYSASPNKKSKGK